MNHPDLQTFSRLLELADLPSVPLWAPPTIRRDIVPPDPSSSGAGTKGGRERGPGKLKGTGHCLGLCFLRTTGIRRHQQRSHLPWPRMGHGDIWKGASVTSPLSSWSSGCEGKSRGLLFVPDFQGHLKKAPQTGGAHKSLPCVLGARAEIKEWHSRFLRPKG